MDVEYVAFISYRHVDPDRRIAVWLHRALERYRIPSHVEAPRTRGRRLGRVFRDEDEVAVAPDLGDELRRRLDASRFLILVCSPRTPASRWVDEEVLHFRRTGRSDRIVAVLAEGSETDAFPPALLGLTPTGERFDAPLQPLAADLRPSPHKSRARTRREALLRIVAGILGVDFDALAQRDARRRRRNLTASLAVSGAVLGAMAYLGVGFVTESVRRGRAERLAQEAKGRIDIARKEKEEAEKESEKKAILLKEQQAATAAQKQIADEQTIATEKEQREREKEQRRREEEERGRLVVHFAARAREESRLADPERALLLAAQAWTWARRNGADVPGPLEETLRALLEWSPYGERVPVPESLDVVGVALSPDGRLLAAATRPRGAGTAGSAAGRLLVVEVAPGKPFVTRAVDLPTAPLWVGGLGGGGPWRTALLCEGNRVLVFDANDLAAAPLALSAPTSRSSGAVAARGRPVLATHRWFVELAGAAPRVRALGDAREAGLDGVVSLAIDDAGRRLAAVDASGAVIQWRLDEAVPAPARMEAGPEEGAAAEDGGGSVAFDPATGEMLVLRGSPPEVWAWPAPGATATPSGPAVRPLVWDLEAAGLSVGPRGTWATAVTAKSDAIVWRLHGAAPAPTRLSMSAGRADAIDDAGARLATTDGRSIRLWHLDLLRSTRSIGDVSTATPPRIDDLAFHPGGTIVLATRPVLGLLGPPPPELRRLSWNGSERPPPPVRGPEPLRRERARLAVSADGAYVLVGGTRPAHVAPWGDPAAAWSPVGTGDGAVASAVAIDPQRGPLRVIVGGEDGSVRAWRIEGGGWVASEFPKAEAAVTALAWSPNGRFLARADARGRVTAHAMDSAAGTKGALVLLATLSDPVTELAFGSESNWLVAGTASGTLLAFDVGPEGPRGPGRRLLEGTSRLRGIASLDARHLLAAVGRPTPEEAEKNPSPFQVEVNLEESILRIEVLPAASPNGASPVTLARYDRRVRALAVHPSRREAVVATDLGLETVTLSVEGLAAEIPKRVRRNLSKADWRRLAPDLPYESTVPGLPEGD